MELSILIVEDDPNDIFLVQRAFSKAAPHVALRFARDAEGAVACLLACDAAAQKDGELAVPSLVLLDLKLPAGSGLDVLSWVRNHPTLKDLPVIVRSSSTEAADVDRAYAGGCTSYVVKSVEFNALLRLAEGIGIYARRRVDRSLPPADLRDVLQGVREPRRR